MTSENGLADLPAYGAAEAARYVELSPQTLRQWISPAGLIHTPSFNILSFNNLAEAHVLKAMRRVHELSKQGIRKAFTELSQIRRSSHPLLEEEFETDGLSLCIREEDRVINLPRKQQQEVLELVTMYLRRVERSNGSAKVFYPFVVSDAEQEPGSIVISPEVSFGKSVIAGTGISTAVIAGRFQARDAVADLAREYGVSAAVLEDAIRWEMTHAKAA